MYGAPPSMEAKDSGISSFEGETPICIDHASTSGTNAATIGVLLMNADIAATTRHIHTVATRTSETGASSVAARRAITPVRSRAFATTNIAATVTGPGSEKPWYASPRSMTRVKMRVSVAASTVKSDSERETERQRDRETEREREKERDRPASMVK
eukprot:COSAG03_NODE_8924_length_759_cov_1.698485_1_plen_155_part_10